MLSEDKIKKLEIIVKNFTKYSEQRIDRNQLINLAIENLLIRFEKEKIFDNFASLFCVNNE